MVKELFLKIIIVSYGVSAIPDIIAYWPTVKDLWRKQPSANTSSYVVWSLTSAITLLYSIFVLPDFLFRLISSIFFVANTLVLFLSLRIKRTLS